MRVLPLLLWLFPAAGLHAQPAGTAQAEYFNWKSSTVAVFCRDFTHYPPIANVEFSQEGCDYSIFFDEHPHLRLLKRGEKGDILLFCRKVECPLFSPYSFAARHRM